VVRVQPSRELRGRVANEDALGFDRLARAFLRTLTRLGPGAVAHVQGAPGSGKNEFMRRCLHYVESDHELLGIETAAELHPVAVWFNAGSYAHQGSALAGLVANIARVGGANNAGLLDRGRDLVTQMGRMRFDGVPAELGGPGLSPGDPEPIERFRRAFALLVDGAKSGQRGRLVVFVSDLDQLPAAQRMTFLDGVRLATLGAPDCAFVIALGREAVLASIRAREGEVSEVAASRILDELTDLCVTVPRLEVRRIGALLRRYLGSGELVVRQAFGDESLGVLATTCAQRSIGIPRAIERLAARVSMLAEFALEARLFRELTAGQWAWVILSERWPSFRRYVIRGGRERWVELKLALTALGAPDGQRPIPAEIAAAFQRDPLLAEFVRAHASAFDADLQGIYWVDDLMFHAGL
jgi:hypothetical protein